MHSAAAVTVTQPRAESRRSSRQPCTSGSTAAISTSVHTIRCATTSIGRGRVEQRRRTRGRTPRSRARRAPAPGRGRPARVASSPPCHQTTGSAVAVAAPAVRPVTRPRRAPRDPGRILRAMAAANKTQPGDGDVDAFLAAVPDERRRADAIAANVLIGEVTGAEPVLWGSSMVGLRPAALRVRLRPRRDVLRRRLRSAQGRAHPVRPDLPRQQRRPAGPARPAHHRQGLPLREAAGRPRPGRAGRADPTRLRHQPHRLSPAHPGSAGSAFSPIPDSRSRVASAISITRVVAAASYPVPCGGRMFDRQLRSESRRPRRAS